MVKVKIIVDSTADMGPEVAEKVGAWWMNAAEFEKASPADGCHMDADNHLALGQAIYQKVKEIMEPAE